MDGCFDIHVPRAKSNFLTDSEALLHLEILRTVQGVNRCQVREGIHYFEASGEPFDEVYGRVTGLITSTKCGFIMRC
jgi:hypothetical protein